MRGRQGRLGFGFETEINSWEMKQMEGVSFCLIAFFQVDPEDRKGHT